MFAYIIPPEVSHGHIISTYIVHRLNLEQWCVVIQYNVMGVWINSSTEATFVLEITKLAGCYRWWFNWAARHHLSLPHTMQKIYYLIQHFLTTFLFSFLVRTISESILKTRTVLIIKQFQSSTGQTSIVVQPHVSVLLTTSTNYRTRTLRIIFSSMYATCSKC